MFFSQEAFEKYSLFGQPGTKSAIDKLEPSEIKDFNLISFLSEKCHQNTDWYDELTGTLTDKTHKLKAGFHQQQRPRIEFQREKRPAVPASQPVQHAIQTPKLKLEDSRPSPVKTPQKTSTVPPLPPTAIKTPSPQLEYRPKSPPLPPPSIKPSPVTSIPPIPEVKKTTVVVEHKAPVEISPIAERIERPVATKVPVSRQNTDGPNQELNKRLKFWYPFKFKLAQPKKSTLSESEQREFIELHNRFKNRTKVTQAEVKFYKKYAHYKIQIEKERAEFLKFAREYFSRALSEDYEFINKILVRYMNEMFDSLESRVNHFERYYSPKAIDLVPTNASSFQFVQPLLARQTTTTTKSASLTMDKYLLQLGQTPKLILPVVNEHNEPFITIDYTNLHKRTYLDGEPLEKCLLEKDPNVDCLTSKYHCNVVMTGSSFGGLVYAMHKQNEKKEDNEEIRVPFKIRVNEATGQKCVYFEKPLVGRNLSKREKNEKLYKRVLLVSFVKQVATPAQTQSHQYPTRGARLRSQRIDSQASGSNAEPMSVETSKEPTRRRLEKFTKVNYNSISELESFGVSSFDTKMAPVETKKNVEELAISLNSSLLNSDGSETSQMQIDLPQAGEDDKVKDDQPLSSKLDSSSDSSKNESSEPENKREAETKPNVDDKSDSEEFKPSKPKIKRIESSGSSDYEGYDEDDDAERGLMIVDETAEKESIAEPASPDDLSNAVDQLITPKAIPLENTPTKPAEAVKKTDTQVKIQAKREQVKQESTTGLNLIDMISKMQEKLQSSISTPTKSTSQPEGVQQTVKLQPTENVRDYTYIKSMYGNCNYSTWNLDSGDQNPIRILIRASNQGYINTATSSFNNVLVYPKLEYQPQFGCEHLSTKDYCQMWAKSFIRNNCDLFLCRVNVFTNRLISITQLKHDEILKKDGDFNPHQCINQLKQFIQRVLELEPGDYLLAKDPGQPLKLMQATTHKTSYDLNLMYKGFAEDQQKPGAWMPIDYDIYMSYHLKWKRVPGLFEPEKKWKNAGSPGAVESNQQANKKKGRRRGKQKK